MTTSRKPTRKKAGGSSGKSTRKSRSGSRNLSSHGRRPSEADGRTGPLLLVGGGEERSPDGEILKRFVELAGGRRARILVCGVAADEPDGTLAEYRGVFDELGAREVTS